MDLAMETCTLAIFKSISCAVSKLSTQNIKRIAYRISHFRSLVPNTDWYGEWSVDRSGRRLGYHLFVCFCLFPFVDVSCTCLRFRIPMHSNLKWRIENWNWIAKTIGKSKLYRTIGEKKKKNHLRAHLKSFPFQFDIWSVFYIAASKCNMAVNRVETTGCNYQYTGAVFNGSSTDWCLDVNCSGKCVNSARHRTYYKSALLYQIQKHRCSPNTEAKHCGFLGIHRKHHEQPACVFIFPNKLTENSNEICSPASNDTIVLRSAAATPIQPN